MCFNIHIHGLNCEKKTTVVEREAYDTAAFNTFCKMGEVADFE